MTPAQAEIIARERLPCGCGLDLTTGTGFTHPIDCPAHYRPAVARALVEAARMPGRTPGTVEVCERWPSSHCAGNPNSDFDHTLCQVSNCPILSSNKTRVEGEG